VADGRAPVQRLERTCVSDWSVALSCHIIQNVLNFTKVNYKNIFCNVCVCVYIAENIWLIRVNFVIGDIDFLLSSNSIYLLKDLHIL
jgi:hypothetical protein